MQSKWSHFLHIQQRTHSSPGLLLAQGCKQYMQGHSSSLRSLSLAGCGLFLGLPRFCSPCFCCFFGFVVFAFLPLLFFLSLLVCILFTLLTLLALSNKYVLCGEDVKIAVDSDLRVRFLGFLILGREDRACNRLLISGQRTGSFSSCWSSRMQS